VQLDVSKNKLPDNFPLNTSKVSSKNNPSVILRVDDSLHKLPPSSLHSLVTFNKGLDRLKNVKEVKTVRDLSRALDENNKRLDDITILYCEDEENATSDEAVQALRLLKHETQHQILRVKDAKLAKAMRLTAGNFYCYYKPSFINGYEAPLNQDMNFSYLQALDGICRDEITVNPDQLKTVY
jgi:hypothetical protein